jgi:hypothetical protein
MSLEPVIEIFPIVFNVIDIITISRFQIDLIVVDISVVIIIVTIFYIIVVDFDIESTICVIRIRSDTRTIQLAISDEKIIKEIQNLFLLLIS